MDQLRESKLKTIEAWLRYYGVATRGFRSFEEMAMNLLDRLEDLEIGELDTWLQAEHARDEERRDEARLSVQQDTDAKGQAA